MVEHGATPTISAALAKEMGFRIMVVPFAALAPAYRAIKGALWEFKETGMPNTGSRLNRFFGCAGWMN